MPSCWPGLNFLQAPKIWHSQITCRDEQSLFPWDGGRKQVQTVQSQVQGRARYLSFLQKMVSTPTVPPPRPPNCTPPPVRWE